MPVRIAVKKQEVYMSTSNDFNRLKSEKSQYLIQHQENPVYWFTSLASGKRDKLSEFLLEEGVQTRRFFYPLHLQPCYEGSSKINKSGDFNNSKQAYETGISLPSSYILKDEEQNFVIEKIKKFFN